MPVLSDEETTYDTKGLDQILKALKKVPTARIGILGSNAGARGTGGGTNYEIGKAHEFGAPGRGLPQRSFLREPISDNLENYMKDADAMEDAVIESVIKTGSLLQWLKKVTLLAETIVLDAFESGGFGKWAKWKNPNYKNESMQILKDTRQLRNSITSEVKA